MGLHDRRDLLPWRVDAVSRHIQKLGDRKIGKGQEREQVDARLPELAHHLGSMPGSVGNGQVAAGPPQAFPGPGPL